MIIAAHLVLAAWIVSLVWWMRFTEGGRVVVAFFRENWRDFAVVVFLLFAFWALGLSAVVVSWYWGWRSGGGNP